MEYNDILIENIKIHISNKLMSKFLINEVKTVGDILSLQTTDFSNFRGVGIGLVKLFEELKIFLDLNKSLVNETNLKNTQKFLIPTIEINEETPLIDIFKNILNDYVSLLSNETHKSILLHFYGLNGTELLTLDDLGIHLGYTNERIRQLRIQIINDLNHLIFIGTHDNIEVNSLCVDKANKLFTKLQRRQLFSLENFITELDSTNSTIYTLDEIRLILDIFGFTILGKVETVFTRGNLIITEKSLKDRVLKIAKIAIKKLKESNVSLSESKLLIEFKKAYRKTENQLIISVLESLPEIESLLINDNKCYQIKFQFLSRASDCAYRVLFENKDKMYIDDISSEINHRFATLGLQKKYNRDSLALVADKRFEPIAKTGYWSLKEWNLNSFSIKDLVIDTMHKFNKPLSIIQITEEVLNKRPLLNKKSIKAIIGSNLIKVDGELWILPEWLKRFSHLELTKRKKVLNKNTPKYRVEQVEAIRDHLNKKEDNKDFAPNIIKTLISKSDRYTKQSFYSLFNLDDEFNKEFDGKKLIVGLKKKSNSKIQSPFELIKIGESHNCEFKSTLRVNLFTNSPDKEIELACLKTIAAFLNTSGGVLLIGVEDNRNIIGLNKDFKSFKKPDKLDEFQKHLDNLIANFFDNSFFSLIKIKFPKLDDKMICMIEVKQSNKPVLLNNKENDFYIRRTGSTVKLNKLEMMGYIKNKWQ